MFGMSNLQTVSELLTLAQENQGLTGHLACIDLAPPVPEESHMLETVMTALAVWTAGSFVLGLIVARGVTFHERAGRPAARTQRAA